MEEILIYTLTFAYVFTGIVEIIAYWPTIKDLYNKKPSANTDSYILWTATSGIAFLYSIFILPDIFFIIVSGTTFFACALIMFLRIRIK